MAECLAAASEPNSSLTTLDLADNGIVDQGAERRCYRLEDGAAVSSASMEEADVADVVLSAGLGVDMTVEQQTIAYFRTNIVPGSTKPSQATYKPFNESRNIGLYESFMPPGYKMDLSGAEFVDKADWMLPWGKPVKICGMIKKGTKKAPKPHGLVRFKYSDGSIIEAMAQNGEFVGLYLKAHDNGSIQVLVWDPKQSQGGMVFLARVNFKTSDWKPYYEKSQNPASNKFLMDRVQPVLEAFGMKT
eukprot:gnl/TRDRNA2_/TRDRNA2_120586_c0_seq1.p1 gnl/TRDRNA2_/TRDRNA2_120586_c0~~gnl/TRDRNA2_/TRDRNA2_120586_c0_seq1.p1  ORF type:complete len:246 (-),score=66.74 gnl/TRDRNA2_/TRDRNA2_120586_c0_seq1:276-1013(-)